MNTNNPLNSKIKLVVLLILWAAVFIPVYPALIHTWLNHSNNSHGLLVPLISLYFVWQKKDKLRLITISDSNWGAGILIISIVYVNYILARKGAVYETVLHWYQSDGSRVFATGIQQNIRRFIGKVINNRNDGAFVRISALSSESHIEESKALVEFFAQKALNLLPKYWPVEQ